tara:strand:+ start:410 stop:1288 length:879 start_codon:yes stop_codon:yes gene_type:complete
MKFDKHIRDLLYRYDCIILPNLGAFVTRNVSSNIDETNSLIKPPQKIISFNSSINKNDGLLANHISVVENISHKQATKKVEKKILSYKKILNNKKFLKIKDVGELSLNDGKYLFSPSNKINFLSSSFGLTEFSTSQISRKKFQASNSYLQYAAILIIALFIGSGIATNYFNEIDAHNQISYNLAEKEIGNKIQKATFIIDNPLPVIKLKLEKQYGDFHIVAGSFRFNENSYTKLNQLKSLGYLDARKIGKNNYGLHQVAYASYNTRQEAKVALNQIREDHNINAWLLYKIFD